MLPPHDRYPDYLSIEWISRLGVTGRCVRTKVGLEDRWNWRAPNCFFYVTNLSPLSLSLRGRQPTEASRPIPRPAPKQRLRLKRVGLPRRSSSQTGSEYDRGQACSQRSPVP